MKKWAFVVSIVLMFTSAITLAAELIIKVTDEGEPVAMAEIFLLNSQTRNLIINDFTNKKGVYQYTVKPGQYDLKVIKDPFADVTINNIEVKTTDVKKAVKLVPQAFANDGAAEPSDEDCE